MSNVIFNKCTDVQVINQEQKPAPDTITIYKPYEIEKIKTVHVPVKVKVYIYRDTSLRKEREKEPIIEKVKITGNQVAITTIDTTGAIKTEIHKVEPDSKLTIDNTGQLEEKKKTKIGKLLKNIWKGTKTGLVIIGGITVAVIIGESL